MGLIREVAPRLASLRLPTRLLIALMVLGSFAEVTVAFALQDSRLRSFERSAAEHLAGSWDVGSLRQAVTLGGLRSERCSEVAERTAESIGDRVEARQACLRQLDSDGRVFSANPNIEPASAGTIESLWPTALLGWPVIPESLQCHFVAYRKSLDPDSINEVAGVITALYAKDQSPLTRSMQSILMTGGWFFTQELVPSQEAHPSGRDDLGSLERTRDRELRILSVANMDRTEAPATFSGSVNRTFMSWRDPLSSDTGDVRFEITFSAQALPIEEAIGLTEQLSDGDGIPSNSDCD